MPDLVDSRARMVDVHLGLRGITDALVLDAFRHVPREAFVPAELSEFAYEDTPLPIGQGQTISQPYIVALTIQEARPARRRTGARDRHRLGVRGRRPRSYRERRVHVERIESLAVRRKTAWRARAFQRARGHGDGSLGLPEHAPYEPSPWPRAGRRRRRPSWRSSRSAAGSSCQSELRGHAKLVRITRESDAKYREEPLVDVHFVPLIGEEGLGPRARPDCPAPRLSRGAGVSRRSCARRPNQSRTSRRRPSTRCSIGSATPSSSFSAKRRTGPASFIGCAHASRASSSRTEASSS